MSKKKPLFYNIWAQIEAVYGKDEEEDYEDLDWPAKVGTYDTLEEALNVLKDLDIIDPSGFNYEALHDYFNTD